MYTEIFGNIKRARVKGDTQIYSVAFNNIMRSVKVHMFYVGTQQYSLLC